MIFGFVLWILGNLTDIVSILSFVMFNVSPGTSNYTVGIPLGNFSDDLEIIDRFFFFRICHSSTPRYNILLHIHKVDHSHVQTKKNANKLSGIFRVPLHNLIKIADRKQLKL
jgi:hypothetical protein